ncbi:RNA polymerase sigma factor [Actinocrispum wychmicini]|uniref:RNA polymerase sigma-70 factor (ECF subfamily) n=1 Tax=Actinocrispum wychmicini TaxID=1213861 RepID=A0A4R2J6R8_9PSEU|nr:RNA polymerase sigma factor [Actinocrispum wychmicini]TCO53787.1 RNA polymerase sigma-70 factor (ECF subfamily) [Actinocrispum wychmicini]
MAQRFRARRGTPQDSTEKSDEPGAARLRVVDMDTYPDWEAIYRDNVDRVYRLMYTKVGNRPDAEDLTTEVFVSALKPLRASATVGEVRAYLLATARTVLATYWRRTLGREITTLDEERDAALLADDDPSGPQAVNQVEAILAELSDRHRRVLQLRFLEGCSIKEAAVELGVTVSNAKVLQHRALRQATAVAERMRT